MSPPLLPVATWILFALLWTPLLWRGRFRVLRKVPNFWTKFVPQFQLRLNLWESKHVRYIWGSFFRQDTSIDPLNTSTPYFSRRSGFQSQEHHRSWNLTSATPKRNSAWNSFLGPQCRHTPLYLQQIYKRGFLNLTMLSSCYPWKEWEPAIFPPRRALFQNNFNIYSRAHKASSTTHPSLSFPNEMSLVKKVFVSTGALPYSRPYTLKLLQY
jgi:hypothetical protein